jgi:hypothetical protein
MSNTINQQQAKATILKRLDIVLEAGHGKVIVEVADHVVVSIKHEATSTLLKGDR